jgi:hypothetical protein
MASIRLICMHVIVLVICLHDCDTASLTSNNHLINSTYLYRDKYGCDFIISSCGSKGKCCDLHDACYKTYKCTAASWFHLCEFLCVSRCITLFDSVKSTDCFDFIYWFRCRTIGGDCRRCNLDMLTCVVKLTPGQSSCCAANNCGQIRPSVSWQRFW